MSVKINDSGERLAVCSWSLQPQTPGELAAKLSAMNIRRVQLALASLRENPSAWADTASLFQQHNITIISGMMGCIGEDYSTLESIRLTGGIAPDATWEQNLKNIRQDAALASELGLQLVTFHAGFLPHEQASATFRKTVERLETVAEIFAARKIALGLETGQETAEELASLLTTLKYDNVGVNFDPANMILYDKGNPVAALRVLAPWLKQVHIKDATRTKIPGTWGEEVPAGTGEVDWPKFFATLRELNFTGKLVIEREAGDQRMTDIVTARDLVFEPIEILNVVMRKKSSRRVNIAVVGLGFMGVTHLRAYQKLANARIVAVCGAQRLPVNGVLRGVAGNIKSSDEIHLGAGVKVYRQFDELLADSEVEAIDICTPTPLHAAQTIAALKAGKHVLCEKPLARTSVDARKILAVAAKSKTFLMPAMCMRFWPGWDLLQQIVAKKTYGKALTASFSRISQMPQWGSGKAYAGSDAGGALFDLHIHDTDFVNFLLVVRAVFFSSGVTGANDSINHVVTQYHFPGGPVVHAEGSWLLASGFNMSFMVNFERATVSFDFARSSDTLQLSETGKKPRVIKLKSGDGYAGEIKYFIDCVANGERPKIVNANDALTALEVCEAEEKSIRRGVIVKL